MTTTKKNQASKKLQLKKQSKGLLVLDDTALAQAGGGAWSGSASCVNCK